MAADDPRAAAYTLVPTSAWMATRWLPDALSMAGIGFAVGIGLGVLNLAISRREVEAGLAGAGRVLLRASGTEPLLRVMVEGRDAEKVSAAAEKLASAVREAVSA